MRELFLYDEEKDSFLNSLENERYETKKDDGTIETKYDSIVEKTKALPNKLINTLKIMNYVILIMLLIIIGAFLKAIPDGVSFKKAISNGKVFIIIGVVLLVLFLVIKIYLILKEKKIDSSDEMKEINNEVLSIEKIINDYFDIPEDNYKIDILIKIQQSEKQKRKLKLDNFNIEHICYVKDDKLCLCDCKVELSFPISSIKSFEMYEDKVNFFMWNKDEKYNSSEYKKYKIKVDNNGNYVVNGYGRVVFDDGYEEFYFDVPPYDFDKLEKLINKN